ncbi:hypothetical protein C2S53_017520, partial [Perilla frutescens var. hirtella]
TSKFCRDKAVVVAVYAEKPRGQGGRHHHLHHHHHHYHHFHQNASKNGGKLRGHNRRAELLDYTRHLRAPAQSAALVSSHPSSHTKQSSTVEVLPADGTRKQKHSSLPTCFEKWSFVATRILRSMTALKATKDEDKKSHKKNVSATAKMKALVKSFQVQKKGSFLSKLFASLKKRR